MTPRRDLGDGGPDGRTLSDARAGESLELRSIGVTLSVDAVYHDPLA